MCDSSLDMQNSLEKLAQQQICMWVSANSPTLINELRKEMEMVVLQVHSLWKIYLEKLLSRFSENLHPSEKNLHLHFWAIRTEVPKTE